MRGDKVKRTKDTICTYCFDSLSPTEVWTLEMRMHRQDPNSSLYRVPCCQKCANSFEDKERIISVEGPPQPKRKKKSEV